jgi:hypothetical protein
VNGDIQMNKTFDFALTMRLGIPNVFVVYDKRLGWIAEYDYDDNRGNMCFMTHNKSEITQDDIDAVRIGVLSVLN